MNNLTHARTCVYNVNYHIVWSVKYRRQVLTEVIEMDHVHVFVSAHPKITPSYIVKMLKEITGRKLFIEFPEIKEKLWKGILWNPSYYLETVGSISEDAVKKYIDKQKKGDQRDADSCV